MQGGGYQYQQYDSTSEHTATCCLGNIFFPRKRRLASSASEYYKPKLALDDDDDAINDEDKLASSTERTLAAAGPVNLNSKYQTSSDDNSRATRLGGTGDNDSYSRAVSHPLPGSRQGSPDLPPRYTPTRHEQPEQDQPEVQSAGPRGCSRQKPRSVSAGRLAKEHEMLQNMWLESHGRRQQHGDGSAAPLRVTRRSSSMGSAGRTVYIKDRATGTCYRRGRLLGKVRFTLLAVTVSCLDQRPSLHAVLRSVLRLLRDRSQDCL